MEFDFWKKKYKYILYDNKMKKKIYILKFKKI